MQGEELFVLKKHKEKEEVTMAGNLLAQKTRMSGMIYKRTEKCYEPNLLVVPGVF